ALQGGGQVNGDLGLDQERDDDLDQHPEYGDGQREAQRLGDERRNGKGQRSVHDRGDDGPRAGLEEVGAHAGDVTHVVTDVVGDHRRVARIVLGDARLDLAHQVGAHVGCLGVDPTTDTGEQGDRGATETYCGDDV